MRSRDVIGKRIVSVRHCRIAGGGARNPITVVDEIELDDGTVLRPYGIEIEGDVEGSIVVVKGTKGTKRKAGR